MSEPQEVVAASSEQENKTAVTTATTTTADEAAAQKQYRREKVAIIFGYSGYGYFGLQQNYDAQHPTIEAALVEALHAVGYISEENMQGQFMRKIQWERASRTDKGVSALRNVVSCKLQLPNGKTEQEWIAPLNAILGPKRISVFRIVIATASFDSYTSCTGRVYEYLLPTYCLLAPSPVSGDDQNSNNNNNNKDSSSSNQGEAIKQALLSATQDEQSMIELEQQRRRPREDLTLEIASIPDDVYETLCSFRLPEDTLKKVRAFFALMEGTNSFHNFTPSTPADDPSANRFMRSITVSDPFLIQVPKKKRKSDDDHDGEDNEDSEERKNNDNNNNNTISVELVRVKLDGQSFMLNQIRKMVGCVVETVIRGEAGGFVRSMFQPDLRRITPMAPANGLFLCTLKLEKYNYRLERIQAEGQGLGREMIQIADVPTDDPMRVLVEKNVCEHEVAQQIMARWISSLLRTKPADFILPPLEKGAVKTKQKPDAKRPQQATEQETREE